MFLEQTKVSDQTQEDQLSTQPGQETEQAQTVTEPAPAEQETEQQSSTGQEELADQLAGYNKSATQQAQQEEAPAQATPQTIAGFSVEEITAKLKKVDDLDGVVNERMRKVFNTLGNLQQRLDSIPKDAPRTEARAITADSMKKLKELGFDELAEALAEDLSGNLSVAGQPQVDVGDLLSKEIRKRAEQDLEDAHPGWKEVFAIDEDGNFPNPEFESWFNTLDESVQRRLKTTESAMYVSRSLDAFKDWQKSKSQPAQSAETARRTSESRLQNAMTATQGKTASAPSRLPDEEGLWKGYNKGPKPLSRR